MSKRATTAPTAVRSQTGVVALFLGAATLAWWWTARRMAGMDAGPGTDLGTLGWFTGAWAVMMAAMMLPSLAPIAAADASATRAHSASTTAGRLTRSVLFAVGYLLVWTAVGVVIYTAFALGSDLFASALAWHTAGRWVAGTVLALAAAYELTPLKAACLKRCGSPHAFVAATPREGPVDAMRRGARNGIWCLGCSGALMAALFALGAMSLTWMALLAALVALEKLAPLAWRRAAVGLTATLVLALAVAMLASPQDVPGLVVPDGSPHAMHAMSGPMHVTGHPAHATGQPTRPARGPRGSSTPRAFRRAARARGRRGGAPGPNRRARSYARAASASPKWSISSPALRTARSIIRKPCIWSSQCRCSTSTPLAASRSA